MPEFDLIARIRERAGSARRRDPRHRRRRCPAAGAAGQAAGRRHRHAQCRRAFPGRHRAGRRRLESARGQPVRPRRDGRAAGVVHVVAVAAACGRGVGGWIPRWIPRARATSTTSRWSVATPRAGRCRSASPCTAWSIRTRVATRWRVCRRRHLGHRHARRCGGGAGAIARRWRGRCGAARAPGPADAADRHRVWRLSGIAHAGIDLSDGLLADLGHVCTRQRSRSSARAGCIAGIAAARGALQCRGAAGIAGQRRRRLRTVLHRLADATRRHRAIGTRARHRDHAYRPIVAGSGVDCVGMDGRPWRAPRSGYVHFAD